MNPYRFFPLRGWEMKGVMMKMSRLFLCGVLSLSSLSVAHAQDKSTRVVKVPPGWVDGKTKHYWIMTEGDKSLLKEYKVVMEYFFRQYAKAFRFKGKLVGRAVVKIYKNRASYLKGGEPSYATAYYNPISKFLVGYNHDRLLKVFSHEATHQFFDLCFPKFYKTSKVPMWFSEGMAECFQNHSIRGRRMYINDLKSENGRRNVNSMVYNFEKGRVIPLKEMLEMSPPKFMKKSGLLYPQSWSFCHFLWNYPRVNGKGKYFKVLVKLIEAFKEGKSRKEAYEIAFEGVSLPKMEAEWKNYVLKTLKANRGK